MSRGADITGHKKGEWTVIRQEGIDKKGTNTWLIQCSCGSELHVTRAKWNAKLSNRCKHHKANQTLQLQGKSLNDTQGAKFGELTILDEKPYIRGEHQRVNVRCECGHNEEMKLCDLVQGRRTCCSKCAAIRGHALRKRVRITWDKPKKIEPLHITEAKAREKGLSYGQMQAMEYLGKKRAM